MDTKSQLKGNLLFETTLDDPAIPRILSDNPRMIYNLKKINHGDLLLLKLATDQSLVVLKKKRSKVGWTGVEFMVFVNRSAFDFYNLICDAELVINKRWPGLNSFMYLNPNSRKHKRLIHGLKRSGWIISSYRSARLSMLVKEFEVIRSAP